MMPRTSSAVRTNPKERRSSARGAPMRHEVALGRERFIIVRARSAALAKKFGDGGKPGTRKLEGVLFICLKVVDFFPKFTVDNSINYH